MPEMAQPRSSLTTDAEKTAYAESMRAFMAEWHARPGAAPLHCSGCQRTPRSCCGKCRCIPHTAQCPGMPRTATVEQVQREYGVSDYVLQKALEKASRTLGLPATESVSLAAPGRELDPGMTAELRLQVEIQLRWGD